MTHNNMWCHNNYIMIRRTVHMWPFVPTCARELRVCAHHACEPLKHWPSAMLRRRPDRARGNHFAFTSLFDVPITLGIRAKLRWLSLLLRLPVRLRRGCVDSAADCSRSSQSQTLLPDLWAYLWARHVLTNYLNWGRRLRSSLDVAWQNWIL